MSVADHISPHDRGLLLGDGLFETVLVVDGKPDGLAQHLARLTMGCGKLGLPPPEATDLDQKLAKALARAPAGRAALRITLAAGPGGRGLERAAMIKPTLIAQISPAPIWETPARLITSTLRRNETSPTSRLKTLSYLDNVLARREALSLGGDEALMLNSRGEIACAAAANVFWLKGRALHTPALACGVLAGIMRARVMAAAPGLGLVVNEVAQPRSTLNDAEAIFLTNSLIGLRPVSDLDGRVCAGSLLLASLAAACEVRD